MTSALTKPCLSCGRRIEWRKKWERDWDNVRYCSVRCKQQKISATDEALEAATLALLDTRARGATICPSEAARIVARDAGMIDDEWRELMEPARRAARRLVARGEVVITQKGRVVDSSTAKGPIRIRTA